MKAFICAVFLGFLLLFPHSSRADPAFDFHSGPCGFMSPATGAIGPVVCRPLVGTDIGGVYADGSSFSVNGLSLAKLLSTTAVQETAIALSGCAGSSATIDLAQGTYFYCTVSTGAVTLLVSNPGIAGTVSSFILEVTNGGSQTINWMSGTKWQNGLVPTLTISGLDIISCLSRDGGVTWRCSLSIQNSH